MLQVIWYECKNKQNWIFALVTILLAYFVKGHVNGNNVGEAGGVLVGVPILITTLYAGITAVNQSFSERQHKTIFFLLSSPLSRLEIYFAKLFFVYISSALVILLQILAILLSRSGDIDILDFLGNYYWCYLLNNFLLINLISLLAQSISVGFSKWCNVLVAMYSLGALLFWLIVYSMFPSMSVEALREMLSSSTKLRIWSYLFYQHYLLPPISSPSTAYEGYMASVWQQVAIFLLLSAAALFLAAWRYSKRDFSA